MPEPLKLLRLPLVSEMSASVKSVVASLKVAVTEKVELMGSAAALVSVTVGAVASKARESVAAAVLLLPAVSVATPPQYQHRLHRLRRG